MNVNFRFRPLEGWSQPKTPESERKSRGTFRAGWANTLKLLDHELTQLDVTEAVIEADFRESDLTMDGSRPRANARNPEFPGVRISFESVHGPLRYATDRFELWQHNVRGIALGLEDLRAVERYGITTRAEQYTGWLQLEGAPSEGFASPSEALTWLRSEAVAGIAGAEGMSLPTLIRHVSKRLHPDRGGDPAQWAKFDLAKQVLSKAGML